MNLTLSLAQLYITPGKLDTNLQKALSAIEEAAKRGSQAILLPECWSSGYDLENASQYAAQTPEIIAELSRLARQFNLCIGGSLLENSPGGIFNSFLWLDPRREGLVRYQKIHLFRLMDEHRWLQPGNCPQIAPTPWGNAGLAICYDLRFPELFRSYALQDTDFFFLSAEWPAKRIHHWKVLTHARAIENLSFMFAVNCIGPATRDDFGGCSMVVSPWGETLAEASPKDEDLLTVTVDIGQISRARNFLPVFQDRRPEIYPLNP